MWKPGTERPSPRAEKPGTPETPKNGAKEEKSSEKKPSSSAKKRLSGATMNMRFMKRKKETDDYEEERRKSGVQSSPIPTSNLHSTTPAPKATPNDKMDIDDDSSTSDDFAKTTTLGLHGMQAMLPGRKSYGGFNPVVEDAWEKSTAAIENRSLEPSRKISDEELLRQYEAIAKGRSGSSSSRPIGNLKGKKGKKKR
mmetsp:Transcript_43058/g.104217  ORF Transcript_43058/g.104217 Transcript_43058/m.104217 type:complete len:197 (+) Transcript_43058:223-813(+)